MRYRIVILLTIFMLCNTMANADVWKSNKSLNRSSSVRKSWNYASSGKSPWKGSSSWNYKGTKLNGITHGGGGDYTYTPNQALNGYEGYGKIDYNKMMKENAMVRQTHVTSTYTTSFSAEPVKKSNIKIVSSKPFKDGSRHSGGGGGGTISAVREYRYGRREYSYGEASNSAVMIEMKRLVSQGAANNVVRDEERMNGAARGDNGVSQGPSAAPTGELGELMLYDRHGGIQGPYGMTPIGDGLVPLLLLASLLVILKIKNSQFR